MGPGGVSAGRRLRVHPGDLAICHLPSGEGLPAWAFEGGPLSSVSRDEDGTTVLCAAGAVPAGVTSSGPFRAIEFVPPVEIMSTGVLATALQPLSAARISVLVVSMYHQDWIIVPASQLDGAVNVLRSQGYQGLPAPQEDFS